MMSTTRVFHTHTCNLYIGNSSVYMFSYCRQNPLPLNLPKCRESEYIFLRISFNPLKTKLFYILFKNPVRTSKRTPTFTITKINWLTLFKFNPLKTKLV